MRPIIKAITIFAPIILLQACASTPPIPPSNAIVSIEGKECVSAPDLTKSISLTPVKKNATNTVFSLVNATSSCINIDNQPSNYIVYALPLIPENHTITIGGIRDVYRTFAPIVSVLDENGQTLKRFEDDRYVVIGDIYGIQLKPQPNARYILVQSNPKLVGTAVNSLETRINVQNGYNYNPTTGYSNNYQMQHGYNQSSSRTFSHEGNVKVIVQALTGKIGIPEEK